MRNLLALVGLVVIVVVGVGLWRGWYKISWKTDSDGHLEVNTKIDTDRATKDVKQGVQQGLDAIGNSLKNKDEPTPAQDFWSMPKPAPSPATLPAPK